MKLCDLHIHSTYSDGTYTPTQIVQEAVALGLGAVALTDHNTVDGLPEFMRAADGMAVEAVAGAEFSVAYGQQELHLLGLFLPEHQWDSVSCLMEQVNAQKEKSNRELIASLNRAGYDLDFDAIKSTTPNGKFNRVQIANALTEKGYTQSIKHAFKTLLDEKAGHYKEPKRLQFLDMVRWIDSIGGVPMLAHPLFQLAEDELAELLPLAKENGLVGLECFYSEYDVKKTNVSLSLADKFGLQSSGGSDFHGKNKPHIQLGAGTGDLRVPYDCFEQLKKIAE